MKDKRKSYGKFAAGLALGATLILGLNGIRTKEEVETKPLNSFQIIEREVPVAPEYSSRDVPANMCSRYTRFAAKEMFNLQYPSADAWDLRDAPNVLEIKVDNKKELEELATKGTLKEGMILGVYNPSSKYNSVAKIDGAGYTHVALYIGQKNGKLYFADKFGKETRTSIDLETFLKRGNLEPREILYLDNQ